MGHVANDNRRRLYPPADQVNETVPIPKGALSDPRLKDGSVVLLGGLARAAGDGDSTNATDELLAEYTGSDPQRVRVALENMERVGYVRIEATAKRKNRRPKL